MASAQVLTRQKYSPIEEVQLKHLPQVKSPLSQVLFSGRHSPLSMTRPEIQRLGSSTSSSKSVKCKYQPLLFLEVNLSVEAKELQSNHRVSKGVLHYL